MTKRRATHGGRREGAGRKPTLEKPSPVLVRFEQRQLDAVDRYGRERKLPSRSAAMRTLVDETLIAEESDHGQREEG